MSAAATHAIYIRVWYALVQHLQGRLLVSASHTTNDTLISNDKTSTVDLKWATNSNEWMYRRCILVLTEKMSKLAIIACDDFIPAANL
jgi:hypothetical protein